MLDIQKPDSVFNTVAPRYRLFNHLASLGLDCWWRWKTIKCLVKCDNLLDIASGTGDLSFEALRQHKVSHVTAIDNNEKMIHYAKIIAKQSDFYDKIEWYHADAIELPFNDNTFDAATCAFGLRNFNNPSLALKQIFRILRSGGQCLILEFSVPENYLLRKLHDIYFRLFVIPLGKYLTGNISPFTYFYRSVKSFLSPSQLCILMQQTGFRHVRHIPLTFNICNIYIGFK